MKSRSILAGLLLIVASSVTNAATVSVSGGINVPVQGSTGPLAVNSNTAMLFNGSGSGATVNGLVQATSTVVGNTQLLTLVLTNFTYSVTSTSRVTIDVRIVQDYVIGAPGATATGSHQINGNTTGTRSGNITVMSMHESTNLPVLNVVFTGAQDPIGARQGQTTSVTLLGGIYTIDTTYRFVIEAGAGAGAIILPDSGVDNATLTLVPLPPAAWTGIAGLVVVGVVRRLRRNAIQS